MVGAFIYFYFINKFVLVLHYFVKMCFKIEHDTMITIGVTIIVNR